jgi:hypothetical protein
MEACLCECSGSPHFATLEGLTFRPARQELTEVLEVWRPLPSGVAIREKRHATQQFLLSSTALGQVNNFGWDRVTTNSMSGYRQ